MKELVYKRALQVIQKKKIAADNHFKQIQDSLFSESKSSAGDKHETARAMAQIELEQAGKLCQEAERLLQILERVPKLISNQVRLGSFVQTNLGYYFISVPLGKITVEKDDVYCLGIQAPFAQALLGKKKGEKITFGEKEHLIFHIS